MDMKTAEYWTIGRQNVKQEDYRIYRQGCIIFNRKRAECLAGGLQEYWTRGRQSVGKGTEEDWTGKGPNVEQEDCKSIGHEDDRMLARGIQKIRQEKGRMLNRTTRVLDTRTTEC